MMVVGIGDFASALDRSEIVSEACSTVLALAIQLAVRIVHILPLVVGYFVAQLGLGAEMAVLVGPRNFRNRFFVYLRIYCYLWVLGQLNDNLLSNQFYVLRFLI